MSAYVSYLLLGLSLAAPIGPINAAQMDWGIKNGFFHAWVVGIGAVLTDGIYMLIVYLGVVQIIDTPVIKTFLWLFGCFVLLYSGIEGLSGSAQIQREMRQRSDPVWKAFTSGFFMSISNPLTILFWLGIYGSVLAETASSHGTRELILYSLAIFSGLLVWDLTMAGISSGFRSFLTARLLSIVSVLSSLSMIGFGVYFGWEGVKLLLYHGFGL
ncbi:MAG TPA: LysE family transporter [Bacillales bacterium]|nr:LysE family transporter [Bacillales bacterium]